MNTANPVILVVEGVDCVGKTTLAKSIAREYNFRYLCTPQQPLSIIRNEVELMDDPDSRFFYYLTSVIAVQKMIREEIDAGKNLVIDRYIYSTFVMHQALGVDTQCIDKKKLPILWPNVSVLLTAKPETRAIRRNSRGGVQEYDQRIEQSVILLDKAQEVFRSEYRWSIHLETDDLSPTEIEQQVASIL